VRLLVLAEDAPDASPQTGNGSSMITAHVLPLLAREMDVDLVHYDDGRRTLDAEVASACSDVATLPVRPARAAALALPFTGLPRASWRRASPDAVGRLAAALDRADAVWAHGLHVFPALSEVLERPAAAGRPRPRVLVHEVDPWADHWTLRAADRRGPRRWYDLSQARRASAVEHRMSRLADTYVVVSPADAQRHSQRLGRPVVAIPNGVAVDDVTGRPDAGSEAAVSAGRAPTIGFLGTLGYPPNVEAAQRLVRGVLPLVAERVPGVQVHLAGRRATPAVTALAGGAVRLRGMVERPAEFFREMDVVVFPGDLGTGRKNTLSEALTAGAAVVASRYAARGVPDEGQLVLAGSDAEIATAVADLLGDPGRRAGLGERARAWGTARLPSWQDAAAEFAARLRPSGVPER
jgi:glycosyltransferase involved in cell wall biosynthesis